MQKYVDIVRFETWMVVIIHNKHLDLNGMEGNSVGKSLIRGWAHDQNLYAHPP